MNDCGYGQHYGYSRSDTVVSIMFVIRVVGVGVITIVGIIVSSVVTIIVIMVVIGIVIVSVSIVEIISVRRYWHY